MMDRQHAQHAVENGAVKWRRLAVPARRQVRRLLTRRRQHPRRGIDTRPGAAKDGQRGGITAGAPADAQIPSARAQPKIICITGRVKAEEARDNQREAVDREHRQNDAL